MSSRVYAACALALAAIGVVPTALANAPFKDVEAWADVRLAYSDAGREWLDGGYSKTRYGSVDGFGFDAELAELSVEWKPTFTHALSALVHLQTSPDQDQPVGLVEGFLRYRAMPRGGWRLSARAGRFFPPVSLEHDGPGWGLTRTLTPSAINSWIGEEVIVTGAEARAARRFGDHHIDLRVSAFDFNDTAGTLLSFRGWALHDVKSTLGGTFRLPDSDERRRTVPTQAEFTDPSVDLGGEIGVYGAVRWRFADWFTALFTVYDNRGDPDSIALGQYGWGTKFYNVGVQFEPAPQWEVIAQALTGETSMGPRKYYDGALRKFEHTYASAFVLAAYRPDDRTVFSGRVDVFTMDDDTPRAAFHTEDGFALTGAVRRHLNDRLELGAEVLYLEHDHDVQDPAVTFVDELQVQLAFKINF